MGIKLRLGLAFSGLVLSSMFGVNMLSGIKDYVDTTGNIMVDIADGIGMVSKGIEYLESYLDPEAGQPAGPSESTSSGGSATPSSTPTSAIPSLSDPSPTSSPASSSPASSPSSISPGSPGFPGTPGYVDPKAAVFCEKGKCYPYDPSKVKNSNLEAKPGMILTPQAKPAQPKYPRRSQEEERLSERNKNEVKKARSDYRENEKIITSTSSSFILQPTTEKATTTTTTTASSTLAKTEPTDPNTPTPSADQVEAETPVSGGKRVLSALRGLLDNTSKLLVRLVSRMFPWNRRARRRLQGEEDEL